MLQSSSANITELDFQANTSCFSNVQISCQQSYFSSFSFCDVTSLFLIKKRHSKAVKEQEQK